MSAVTQEISAPALVPKDLYEVGEVPPLGHIPKRMYAWVIRRERHGPPEGSMLVEVVPTWSIADDEVLMFVMAGGVNYNGIWAALGKPISPLDTHNAPYHIAGSDAAGVVWAIGAKVRRWKVGDEVIVHCNQDTMAMTRNAMAANRCSRTLSGFGDTRPRTARSPSSAVCSRDS